MNNKLIFKTNPISYSQFLDSKNSLNEKKEQSGTDLQLFKYSQTSPHHFHRIYASKKKEGMIYQLIFYSLSILFIFLGCVIYVKTTNWKCDFYLGNSELAKLLCYSFCLLLSASTFGIGLSIYPEKETVQAVIHKSKKHLNRFYREYRRIHHPFFIFFWLNKEESSTAGSVQRIYYDSLYRIEDLQEKTLELIERISSSKNLHGKVKEQLFSEAVHELHELLNHILEIFQQKLTHKKIQNF
jgi:hypothetical protein